MPPKKTKTEKPSKAVWTLSNKEDFRKKQKKILGKKENQ